MTQADERTKLESDVVTGVEAVKTQAWETFFLQRITAIRAQELSILWKSFKLSALNTLVLQTVPTLVTIATFAMYVLLGNTLTANKAFTSLSLFSVLRFPLFQLPMVVSQAVKASVAFARLKVRYSVRFVLSCACLPLSRQPCLKPAAQWRRRLGLSSACRQLHPSDRWARTDVWCAHYEISGCVQDLLSSEEKPVQPELNRSPPGGVAARLQGAIAWAPDAAPVLHSVDFEARTGELVVIVGATGTGKSTFLAALLGLTQEMEETRIELHGKVAYVAQHAYIFGGALPPALGLGASRSDFVRVNRILHILRLLAQTLPFSHSCVCSANFHDEPLIASTGTVQDNILFDLDWSPGRYEKAIAASNLSTDLEQMPAGDQTELGEGVRALLLWRTSCDVSSCRCFAALPASA